MKYGLLENYAMTAFQSARGGEPRGLLDFLKLNFFCQAPMLKMKVEVSGFLVGFRFWEPNHSPLTGSLRLAENHF
jgi:hypothetical protein